MNLQFGSGVLYGLPNAGNLAVNPTPYRFGVLQEVTAGFKGDLKKLYGQKQFPVAKARGKIDVTVKAKLGVLDPNLLNQLYFAQASAAGITLVSDQEPGTVGGGSATARANSTAYVAGNTMSYNSYVYKCVTAGTSAGAPPTFNTGLGTYTSDGTVVWQCLGATGNSVLVANAGTFATDYGVQYASTGQQLTCVTSGPTQGQYNVVGGNYTFAAADAGTAVLISYTYTSATRGATITLSNQLMGYAPEFRALLYNTFRNKIFALDLFNCTASEISVPTKQEEFWLVDINFDACADASDTLGKIYADLS